MKFVLTSSSMADMPASFFSSRDIPYAPVHFMLDGVDYLDDLGVTVPYQRFYERIRQGAMPTTSQVNFEEYIKLFEPVLESGRDILHVEFSSGLSGSIQSAAIAWDMLKEKYPDRTVMIADSLAASSGYGLLLETVADLRDAGKGLSETHDWIIENRLKMHHWFFSTDLSHYRRGGRISATTAIIGGLLGICPLMNVDKNGKLNQFSKVRGKRNIIIETVKRMEEHANGGVDYDGKCIVSHSADEDEARKVAALVEETFPRMAGKIRINDIGTVIGTHTGPGTVALFFYGDKRNF